MTATPSIDDSPALTAPGSRRRIPIWLAIVAASLPMFMATLDNLIMTSALPVIRLDLNASIGELQWFVNAYTLAFATFMLMAVAVGDRLGRRSVFVFGIALFTVASAFSALSTDPWMLIVGRAFQGVGAAALMPLSLTLLVGSVSTRLRPLAIGIWGGVSGLGVALGPLIGGAVIEGWNWEAIFWLNVPTGIISVPLALLALPNTFGARLRADVLGLALVGVGVLGVVYGIVRGNDAGWSSVEVVGSLVVGAVLLVAFVVWESRTTAPLLPLRLFRDRSFSVANVVGFVFSFGIFGSIFILIQFLQIVQGHSPLEAGLMTMPWTMAPLIVAPLTGLITPRIGTRLPVVVGLAFQSVGVFWLAGILSADATYASMIGPFLFAGIGMGLVFAPSSTAVLVNMSSADQAKASGTNSTLREVGVALGIAVLTAVFTGAGGQLTPTGYVGAAIPAVIVGASALALSALLALLLPAGRATRTAPTAMPATAPATAPVA
ncbi:DHA2 family efflux MFS transporter permease subunit [Subtercola boreus]|uniref:MFS transporter n=1 Tax=Subtercola boreus TaxID=120213 RepID=A0A3E0W7E0_9MICO|nr:DHA2 family efflux MFS transporter permease subunit [Subtercola boreus]RFA17929.1 MFS transporter [Subtercola boreus]RFA18311.1 MFS transporter [Subtercola boreus]RFA24841.1 MFS transporter [Subtercola boreus]